MKKEKTDIRLFTKQFYQGNKLRFAFAILHMVLGAACALLVSWLLQQLIDLIGGYDTGFTLVQLVWISLLCLGIMALSYLIGCYTVPRIISGGMARYREYVFGELTKKNISAFAGENSSAYISALTNDIPVIEQGYLRDTFTAINSLLPFIGAMALMIWYSPLLTLIAIGLSMLPLAASLLTGSRMALAEKRVSDGNERYTASLKDCLSGFSVVKSFRAERQMLRIFRAHVQSLSKAQNRSGKLKTLIQMFGALAGIIAQLGVFLFGAWMALSGRGVTAGTTLIFVQLMNYVLSPIGAIPTCLAERKAAKALIEKLARALNANVREEKEERPIILQRGIEIRDLSFGYDQDQPVLKNIHFRFDLGKKYAIVGASGSGKSTLLNLLMAYHQAYTGAICYDDTELREIGTGSLYEIESIIQQHVFVFNATIRENITMFRDFPDDQVQQAIRLSGLSALIREKGEDYLCGENGAGLSGGEKQRISIARSLLKKSQVLLVDEATAALDAETAYQVSSAILGLQGITTIVVTHALDEGLLRQYDGILTLKNGAVIESGTFEELIAQKGYFYSLFTVSQ